MNWDNVLRFQPKSQLIKWRTHVNETLKRCDVRVFAVNYAGDNIASFDLLCVQIGRNWGQCRWLVTSLKQRGMAQAQAEHYFLFLQQLR